MDHEEIGRGGGQAASHGVTRRGFAAGTLSLAALAAMAPAAQAESTFRPTPEAATGSRHRRKKPNILLIMADDLGAFDLSCYGAPHISTPNLDRLAKDGVRFTQSYSGSSTCSPTRFSLQTGRYPGRFVGGLAEPIAAVNEREGLPPGFPSIASLLKGAGYSTRLLGKWHLGYLPWFSPLKSGYDDWFGSTGGGLDYFSKISNSNDYDLYENDIEYQDLRYYTDIITERTLAYINGKHTKPWFVSLNYTTPHWPWEGPNDQAVSADLTARSLAGEPGVMFHYDGGSVEKYVEMVENMDQHIGRVLRALKRTGQDKNTIVVFKADNGGERYSYQWPLRGSKWDVWEGGIRIPLIVSWPGRLKGRQVSHEPIMSPDITHTLVRLGGASPDPANPMDGRDFSDYLFGSGAAPAGDLFWRVIDQGALRRGKWKYFYSKDVSDGPIKLEALYDLEADQSEQANLIKKNPEVAAELRAAHAAINATLLPYPPGTKRYVSPPH